MKARHPSFIEMLKLVCEIREVSPATTRKYLSWNKRYIKFLNRKHPEKYGAAKVEEFLKSQKLEHRLSNSTVRQAEAALRFMYRHLLKRATKHWDFSHIYIKENMLRRLLRWL